MPEKVWGLCLVPVEFRGTYVELAGVNRGQKRCFGVKKWSEFPKRKSPKSVGIKGNLVERVTGIEPAWSAWKAGALPLSYTRELFLHE